MRCPLAQHASLLALLVTPRAAAQAGLVTADFERPRAIATFSFSDPDAWRVSDDGRSLSLELHGRSDYRPPHRSPLNIALLGVVQVGDFALEAELQQTGREYGHRDMCVFFGFQDPAHYYYVHLATKTDEHAHNIFLVDGAARRKISTTTTAGVDWGRDAWHRVRIERSVAEGTIAVFFDDMTRPIMTARDRTLGWGQVGFGSFDDTGRVDNVHLGAPAFRAVHGAPFPPRDPWAAAAARAERAAGALAPCHRYLHGWLAHADPASGLIPRNLGADRDVWNAADAAADNYPFMVMTASITDRSLFAGRLRDMLEAETRLTSRLGALPDDYALAAGRFRHDEPDLDRMIFGASEYMKDGLLPLAEWLGPSPWSERLLAILEDVWRHAAVETAHGPIPSTSVEVNGELLQVLSRVYWMTGDEKHLDRAIRLGDHYLLGDRHPTRDAARLRLRDHGCEIVGGLVELYVACRSARPAKGAAYRPHVHAMLDRILDVGRNEDGMLYNVIDPRTGAVVDAALADTWGYTYDAVYAVSLVDEVPRYRRAVRRALVNLPGYHDHAWEGESADGYADAIESAINLFNREPVPAAAGWIDTEMRTLLAKQRPDGVVEGWHGDGNFARTVLMYALWKTQGVTPRPWRADVRVGAVEREGALHVHHACDAPWTGRIVFDRARHRTDLHLPLDYPRINQMPEWFTVDAPRRYEVTLGANPPEVLPGRALLDGLVMKVEPGAPVRLRVRPVD